MTEIPEHLSERSKQLWHKLVPKRAKSVERVALLQTALEALDRADLACSLIQKEGMVLTTERTGAAHIHPAVKIEKESRQLFAKIWTTLGFTIRTGVDDRDF